MGSFDLDTNIGHAVFTNWPNFYFSDKCSVFDFSVCSSFYSKTGFPNFYNYTSYQAAVTHFQNSLQPVIDSQCSSVSTVFLCGLNFPKCSKGKRLLPCRSLCESKYYKMTNLEVMIVEYCFIWQ